jgi:DNA topoisomerase III
MKRILCVAEKPSISKSISNLLSSQINVNSTGNKFIKNYEFQRGNDQVTMTALLGHLNVIEYKDKTRWELNNLDQLFTKEIETRVNPEHKDIEKNLLKLARHSDLLIIWTDCDREGENIGAEVANLCKTVNPRIEIKRARFSVIQRREICQAYENLVELDLRLAAAVDARSELDLRIGAIFTRFQTLLLRDRFQQLQDQKVISYGTCQFPTLGFIVERFLKAKNFIAEEFWTINLSLTKQGITTKFNWDRNRVYDHNVALALYEQCHNSLAEITSITASPKQKYPPFPLTTVELQKNGSKFLKISSDKLMKVLYAF